MTLDAVIAAAVLAFGFVYVHPFIDGNGRTHRYLIHHVLAQRGFNPAGVVFPVSAAILARIDEYRAALEDYSRRLLPVIDWEPTADSNVKVLNETADFYRFFDAMPHAEFLYTCVKQTIEEDLPRETEFLERYDQFRARIEAIVDMPDRTIDLLFRFLHQNVRSPFPVPPRAKPGRRVPPHAANTAPLPPARGISRRSAEIDPLCIPLARWPASVPPSWTIYM